MGFSTPRAAVLCMLALACPLPGRAQSGNEGSIEGTVTDTSGAMVPSASVKLRQHERGATFVVTTDANGLFRFPILPLGTYELTVERTGFDLLVEKNVEVTVGTRINLTLTLRLSAHSESVVVSGATPIVETTRSQVSATVASRDVSSLPVNGRNFLDLALLTPGVTRDHFGGLSFAGQRKLNSILVDGADNNDTFFNERLGVGTPSSYQFSLEAVQEFQVNSNAYSAEFGFAGGGVVNAVTKSGTNEFHGASFWYYRDKGLNANDLVNKMNGATKSPYHFQQFGGVLGGPMWKNRSFFFLNYEGQRSRLQTPVFLNLPSSFRLSSDSTLAAFQQKALDYLASRTGPRTNTFDQDIFFGKLDWRLARGHALTTNWNRRRFTGQGLAGPAGNSGPQIASEHSGTVLQDTDTAGVSLSSALSTSVVNVARFYFVRSASVSLSDGVSPEANVFQGGQLVLSIGRQPGIPNRIIIQREQFYDTVSYIRGRHSYRFGADVLLDRIPLFTALNFSGSYRFRSLESFGRSLAGVPMPLAGDDYLQAFSGTGTSGTVTHPDFVRYAGFLQDEWRVRPGLTLNLGLRYDLQVIAKPTVRNPSPALAAAGLDTSFLHTDKNNLAPRLGLAWAPLGNGRMVVRLGYGLYYGFTPSLMTERAHSQNGLTVQTRRFSAGTPNASLIPAYPNTLCGPPDPSGMPPSCAAPAAGITAPLLILFSRTYRQPYVQQGSFGVEYQVGTQSSVAINYLVARGVHLQRVRDVNLATPETLQTIPIAGTATLLSYTRFTLPPPIAGFDRILLMESGANSTYHGATVQVNNRFARNWELLGSFTFGKVIDDVPDSTAVTPGVSDNRMLSDSSNPRADRAPGINDQRHRFVLRGIWQLNYADHLPRTARAVFGGWEVSGILTAQSGQPYSGMVNFDLNNDGNSANDRTPGLGRDTFYLPTSVSFDPRVTRNVKLTERAKLQIIWEAFNVLNHANITGVRTTQFSRSMSPAVCGIAATPCLVPQNTGLTAFGTPTASSGPRIMQLAAKFVF